MRKSFGSSLLMIAIAAPALAVPVAPFDANGLASVIWAGPYHLAVLTTSGAVLEINMNEGGGQVLCRARPELAPPVPVSVIRDWSGAMFITNDAKVY